MGITINDLLIREYAPQIVTGFGNTDYAARKILPPIRVASRQTKIAAFTADRLRLVSFANDGRTPATEVNRGISFTNLDPQFYAGGVTMTAEELAAYPSGVNAVQDAYGDITEAMQIEEEYALAAALTTTGNYTLSNYGTPTTKWDAVGGDPLNGAGSSINLAKKTVRGNCGKAPNCIAVSYNAHLVLSDFARESLGGLSNYGMPTNQDLARFYGFEQYIVLGAIYNSAVEGQTSVLASLWGDENVFVFYNPTNPRAKEPAFGYTVFIDNEMSMGKKEDTDPQPITRFIVGMSYQSKVLSYAAGYYIYNTLT